MNFNDFDNFPGYNFEHNLYESLDVSEINQLLFRIHEVWAILNIFGKPHLNQINFWIYVDNTNTTTRNVVEKTTKSENHKVEKGYK